MNSTVKKHLMSIIVLAGVVGGVTVARTRKARLIARAEKAGNLHNDLRVVLMEDENKSKKNNHTEMNESEKHDNSEKKCPPVVVDAPKERHGDCRCPAADLSDHGCCCAARAKRDRQISKHGPDERRRMTRALVEEGVQALENNDLAVACDAFSHTPEFVKGELYLFLFDEDGVCLAHGQQSDLIWHNLYDHQGAFGTYVVREIIQQAKAGGGWISYEWRGATKRAFIKPVMKDGKLYALGAGYYRHDKQDEAMSLVRAAVHYFDQEIKQDRAPSELLSQMTYPIGPFVRGDLYLYAVDEQGVIRVHARHPRRVGMNALSAKDEKGTTVTQQLIEVANKDSNGTWMEYTTHNALKRVYVHRVSDKAGQHYYIACGYYPEENHDKVRDLVRRGHTYLAGNGQSVAAEAFTAAKDDRFRQGRIYLAMYDLNGVCLAHGGNPEMVGKNHYDEQDEDGRYYVREMIKLANRDGGWLTIKLNGAFKLLYVDRVDLGMSEVIITSGFYPASKHETMKLMVKSGVSLLEEKPREEALAAMVKKDGRFMRGDLRLFVFGTDGVCYAYADRHALIWRNLLDLKDDTGMQFVKAFIERSQEGPDRVKYQLNGMPVIAYVERATKDGRDYVVGSSYYE